MRVGIATDHGGFILKEELLVQLRAAGHDVVDFGAHELNPLDDYPDIIVPLALAVAAGDVPRGIAICGCGVGVPVAVTTIDSCTHSGASTILRSMLSSCPA